MIAGATVSVVALVLAYGVLPFARRWSDREDRIAASADRLSRLRSLVANERELRAVVAAREAAGAAAGTGRGILAGRTPALAASSLQSAIQEYATRSRVSVSRLDVAGAPDTSNAVLPMIPASLSAVGDIYGISEFLSLLQRGSPVIEIRELTLISNSSLRDGLIQLSISLRAPSAGE